MARTALLLALLALTCGTAIARPLGDFGRPEPSLLYDEVLPFFGGGRALPGKPSPLIVADEEVEMHDRIWRFLQAPYVRNWAVDLTPQLRPVGASGTAAPQVDRYFRYLKSERYASSRVRYNSIADDAWADAATMTGVFVAICAVEELDRRRGISAASLEIAPQLLRDQRRRADENHAAVAVFVAAAAYRLDAYDYALDQMLVESPHEESIAADRELSALAGWVALAEAGEFCSGGGFGHGGDEALPGRVLMAPPGEGEFRK